MSSSPDSQSQSGPPCYVLVSHCPLAVDSSAPAPSYTLFSHPTIEYHYADDLPHALLPQSPDEHVVVLDYDPALGASPTAHCLSTSLAVVAVKVAEAPGAGLIEEDGPKNSKMYVVQTTTKPDEMADDEESPHMALTRFVQRNAMLRRVLDYPHPLTEAKMS